MKSNNILEFLYLKTHPQSINSNNQLDFLKILTVSSLPYIMQSCSINHQTKQRGTYFSYPIFCFFNFMYIISSFNHPSVGSTFASQSNHVMHIFLYKSRYESYHPRISDSYTIVVSCSAKLCPPIHHLHLTPKISLKILV